MKLLLWSVAAGVATAARLNRQALQATVKEIANATASGQTLSPEDEHKCQNFWPAELDGEFSNVKAVGSGATACVFLAQDNTGTTVAVKVGKGGKGEGRFNSWKDECESMQAMRMAGCHGGHELYALHQMYLPTCTKVARLKDSAYYVMHAAGVDTIGKATKLGYTAAQKRTAFFQLIAAVYALHAVDLTHNDLHGNNACLDDTRGFTHLALIDFGSLKTQERSWKRGYKRDSNAIWRHGAQLAECPEEAQWPRNSGEKQAQAFKECMNKFADGEPTFVKAMNTLIDGDVAEDTDHHIEGVYKSKLVQDNLPKNQVFYPWEGAGQCDKWTKDQWGLYEAREKFPGYQKCDKVATYNTDKTKAGRPRAHCSDGNDYRTACFSKIPGGRWRCGKCEKGKVAPKFGGCLFRSHPLYEYAGK